MDIMYDENFFSLSSENFSQQNVNKDPFLIIKSSDEGKFIYVINLLLTNMFFL